MRNYFKKSQKTYFGAIFAQTQAEINFPGKKRTLSVFKYSNCQPPCQKSEKLLSHFCEKCRIDYRIMNYRRVFTFPNLQQNF